jgi:hypothetical protein
MRQSGDELATDGSILISTGLAGGPAPPTRS